MQDAWGSAVDPQKLEDPVGAPGRDCSRVRACGTSTGAQSDAKTLVELAHKHDCLAIVDAVTSLAGTPLKVDGGRSMPSTPGPRSACLASRYLAGQLR